MDGENFKITDKNGTYIVKDLREIGYTKPIVFDKKEGAFEIPFASKDDAESFLNLIRSKSYIYSISEMLNDE